MDMVRKCKVVESDLNNSVKDHNWQLVMVDCAVLSDESIAHNLELNFIWKVVIFRDLDNKVDIDAIG